MPQPPKKISFPHNILIIGFGSIGQGVLPLILRHIDIPKECITIVTADKRGKEIAEEYGVTFIIKPLKQNNYQEILKSHLKPGDFLLNLSVDVSTVDLISFCAENDVLYLDTVIEPWEGGYTDTSIPEAKRTNYALREDALVLRKKYGTTAPTAVLTHGANPGLVSHFVKKALIHIAKDTGQFTNVPQDRAQWAKLACDLHIKTIHIAERDTQICNPRKHLGEFVNTWSVDGFVGEGSQPAELGWGSHEKHFPPDGKRFDFGCTAAIFLGRPGAATEVRSWTPLAGSQTAFLITHGESISLADYFTIGDTKTPTYRPTVHYAYHPSDDTVLSVHEFIGKNFELQKNKRVVTDEIVSGIDELGVLLMGHEKGAYWYGSRLSVEEARRLTPHNSATALQVTAGVLSGVIWAIKNPRRGVIEPDEMPFDEILRIAKPYLGKVMGEYSDWTPLENRNHPLPEDLDESDPWQFKNFRIT
ncbi:MAG: saccharopine dehydrogenase NADP-binding domain-containing protein [Candidatus Moranbacteria bacterium]|nr:saccharopine dehydrogenase NADP-binding domain-containing protein [Candidatus Moranbacteria bacterium]